MLLRELRNIQVRKIRPCHDRVLKHCLLKTLLVSTDFSAVNTVG